MQDAQPEQQEGQAAVNKRFTPSLLWIDEDGDEKVTALGFLEAHAHSDGRGCLLWRNEDRKEEAKYATQEEALINLEGRLLDGYAVWVAAETARRADSSEDETFTRQLRDARNGFVVEAYHYLRGDIQEQALAQLFIARRRKWFWWW